MLLLLYILAVLFCGCQNSIGSNKSEESVSTVVNHLVSFDSQGDTIVASQTVPDGAKVAKPLDPTSGVHGFLGWYNGDSVYDFDSPVKDDLTLTARWTSTVVIEDTVRYDSTLTYINSGHNVVQVGYLVLDMNAHTYTNYWITQSLDGSVTYMNSSNKEVGMIYSSGTFVRDTAGFTYTVKNSPMDSTCVGKSSTYQINGSEWTWTADPFIKAYGNSYGHVTTVLKTILTTHSIEK